jgi:hypothetical protein
MQTLSRMIQSISHPSPHNATSVLMLMLAVWGIPSMLMLLVPAFIWHFTGQLSVGWFASAVIGLFLLLAYGRFVAVFIGIYNGEDWLREQWEQILRKIS